MADTPLLKRLSPAEVLIDKPLEEDVYDADGTLLLSKGAVLKDPTLKSKVVERGHRKVDPLAPPAPRSGGPLEKPREPVFSNVQHIASSLNVILTDYLAGRHAHTFESRIRSLATRLAAACADDAEAAIAAIHLFHEGDYAIRHHLSVATVTALIAQGLDLPAEAVNSLVCAAATHDIGILQLANHTAELPERHKILIRQHPTLSLNVLKEHGVEDPLWLEAVMQHHERLDGTGYPYGLSGSEISQAGRILAVADVYCAMTRPRPYRPKAYFPMAAMRDLYVGQSHQLDNALIQMLIKVMGLVPPGSLVRLKNGELAVVKKRSNSLNPLCFALQSPTGTPLMPPERRDTREPTLAISGRVDPEQCTPIMALIRRLWA